jgi:hypothetical protein
VTPNKPRTPASAHDILLRLIDACGGPKIVAAFLGVRLGTAYSWTDPDTSPGSAPFAQVCLLTEHFGITAAAEHLALLAGGVFVPLPSDDGELDEHAATLTLETAEIVGEIIRCTRSNSEGGTKLTPAERARLKRMAFDVMRVMSGILSELREGE